MGSKVESSESKGHPHATFEHAKIEKTRLFWIYPTKITYNSIKRLKTAVNGFKIWRGEEMTDKEIDEQAKEILRQAEKNGVQSNFFFMTTFERYLEQLQILKDLKKSIAEDGTTVSKEYVKGRMNIYTNPSVNAFNSTTTSANRTVETLIKIIKGFKQEEPKEVIDPLVDIINGGKK